MESIDAAAVAARIEALFRSKANASLTGSVTLESSTSAGASGFRVPDPLTLLRIAELAGVSIDWLLQGDAPEDASFAQDIEFDSQVSTIAGRVPPPVNMVLNHPLLEPLRDHLDPAFLVNLVRTALNQNSSCKTTVKEAATEIADAVLRSASPYLLQPRHCVNATGIIIHTGWGNASLHPEARSRLLEASGATATGATTTLSRTELCERLLCAITGAEAATVTTLNAVNYVLLSGALAVGREIVVAARDLVEISQGARIGDLLASTGAKVLAVGSANCVYLEDYQRAITPQTAILLRVRASNTATSGYTHHVSGGALCDLAREHGLVYAENLGGGSLVDLTEHGFPSCPTLQQSLTEGADIVFASADKIIGGPQAGIVVGKKSWVSRLAKHPLARISRPDKLTLAAMEATLAVYLRGAAWDQMPTLRLLKQHPEQLRARAGALAKSFKSGGFEAVEVADKAECGGAVLPGVELPTWAVKLEHPELREDQLHAILLARGVVTRRKQGAVLLDLRSVVPEDDERLRQAIVQLPA